MIFLSFATTIENESENETETENKTETENDDPQNAKNETEQIKDLIAELDNFKLMIVTAGSIKIVFKVD